MKKETNFSTIEIILDNGKIIKCNYPEDAFEDIYERLKDAMMSGEIFQISPDDDEELWFYGNFLTDINGNKIVGLNWY